MKTGEYHLEQAQWHSDRAVERTDDLGAAYLATAIDHLITIIGHQQASIEKLQKEIERLTDESLHHVH